MIARVGLAACAVLVAACGFSSNNTAARTLPFHPPLADLEDYEVASAAPLQARPAAGPVTVRTFQAYYPLPVGFAVAESGFLGGQNGWAALGVQAELRPEHELPLALGATFAPGAGAGFTIDGVVTQYAWYESADVRAGRVASILVVRDAGGRVVFEGERVTGARARDPRQLFAEHARQWSNDSRLRAAVGAR